MSQSETKQCLNPTSEERRHPHKPTLLKREAARNLAHVIKIVSHHDTAACIFSDCCRNVSSLIHVVRLQDQVKQKKPRSSEPGLLSFRVWSVAAIDSTVGSPHQGVALHKVISILMRPIRAIIAYRCGPEMMPICNS